MTYITRAQEKLLGDFLNCDAYQVAILYGARRTGKTTLVKKFLEDNAKEYQFYYGEELAVQKALSSRRIKTLENFVGDHNLLFIDEAQAIENIGIGLKILVDNNPKLKIIVTGSSTLDLGKNIGEPLVGRATTIKTFPISQYEFKNQEDYISTVSLLESRLIYGSYPVIATIKDQEKQKKYLNETVQSYLLKDILEFDGIRNSQKIKQLLSLIAFQIGNEVSLTELGKRLELTKDTVGRYLDLLEKCFVIFSRYGFSRRLRNEITRNHHYYFYDNGIRNALIQNFNPLDLRDDVGQLWENYIVAERLKRTTLKDTIPPNSYFWRTYEQQEIDLVEEQDGKLKGFEIKYSPHRHKAPPQWTKNYPEASFETIDKENYLEFIT